MAATSAAAWLRAKLRAAPEGAAVAFDADGTLWRGDVGEDFLRYAAAQGFVARDAYRTYEAHLAVDLATAYGFCAQVLAGRTEAWVEAEAQRFFDQRFAGRVFRYVRPLLAAVARKGLQPWIVSASPRWLVQAGARRLGMPAEQVLAVSVPVVDGKLTGAVQRPVPCGAGKAAVLRAAGVRPFFALGNGAIDVDMLAAAEHALVVAPRDEDTPLVHEALRRHWPILRV